MVKKLNTFREQAAQLRVAPPADAWQRIDSRLQVDQAGRKFRRARILSYAASVALVVAALTASYYIIANHDLAAQERYSDSIEYLPVKENASYGIYDIERVKQLSLLMRPGLD